MYKGLNFKIIKENSVQVGKYIIGGKQVLKRGHRRNPVFQVPATDTYTLLPLVKIEKRLAICRYPHKISH